MRPLDVLTGVLAAVTMTFFVLAVLSEVHDWVPMEAFLWGGLILILAWAAHDWIREKRGDADCAYRIGEVD